MHTCTLFWVIIFMIREFFFIDRDLNGDWLKLLPNCTLIEEYLPDDYVFEDKSILISDIFSDNTEPSELEFNLLKQLVWGYQFEYYFVKFCLPWFDKDMSNRELKVRYDVRTLLSKSRFNSSEMRLWGTKKSTEKILYYDKMDGDICFFNRFNRFEHNICYDCHRIGKFFSELKTALPDIVKTFLEDRGYEIWRFIEMYDKTRQDYKLYSRNEQVYQADVRQKEKLKCMYPKKLCSAYSNCKDCVIVWEDLFSQSDYPFIAMLIDFKGKVFTESFVRMIRSSSMGEYLSTIEETHIKSIKMLRDRSLDSKQILYMLDWGGITPLDSEGNPI